MITKMFFPLCLPLVAFCSSIFGQPSPETSGAPTSTSTAKVAAVTSPTPPETAPLHEVMKQVKKALDQYQHSLGSGSDALPPLESAEFDFKITTATTRGGSINFIVFKFGGSTENSVVNDVTYTYSVPPPPKLFATEKAKKPPTLPETLADTIQTAAAAVKTSGTLGNLKFNKLVANIQYGVKWDVNAAGTFTYYFVTVGLNADKNKNTVQSVKLTFHAPEKAK